MRNLELGAGGPNIPILPTGPSAGAAEGSAEDAVAEAEAEAEAESGPRKICIIGAGLVGLGYLQAVLDLPEEARKDWIIDCYESRDSPGGIWLPQPTAPPYPTIPATPAYDNLETITPGPGITFPNRPLPPSTPLFPRLETVNAYIQQHVSDFNLSPYINVRHSVSSAVIRPCATEKTRYPWTITIERTNPDGSKNTFAKRYSTLIVGNGITPLPREISLPGQYAWLSSATNEESREIMHSMWYRTPEFMRGKTVIVVGYHASGRHIVTAACKVAKEVYHCYTPDRVSDHYAPITSDNYHACPRLLEFGETYLQCGGGVRIPTPPEANVVVLGCTGYWRIHPFLSPGVLARLTPEETFTWDSPTLTSNNRFVRPLYHCLMPVDPEIPYGSMAFGCLFPIIWSFPTSYAQGLWFGHLMADLDAHGGTSALVPPREEALRIARDVEDDARVKGIPIDRMGYFLPPLGETTDDLSDKMIRDVRKHSSYALPKYLQDDPKREYTEPWRRRAFEIALALLKPWAAAYEHGGEAFQRSFTKGAATEEDFAAALESLEDWYDAYKPRGNEV